MNSTKCPECGLVNFASASECKRCHLKFHQRNSARETSPTAADEVSSVSDQPSIAAHPRAASTSQPSSADRRAGSPAVLPEYLSAEPKRLSAPMILFVVYLLLSAAVLVFQFTQFLALSKSSIWKHLTDPDEMLYIPGFAVIIYASWFLNALAILASLLLIIPLVRRSRSFLKFVRVYLVFSLIYCIVEVTRGLSLRYALTQRLTVDLMTEPMFDRMYWVSILKIVGFLVTFIWFRYFTTSDRVKKTFVK